MPSHTSRIRAGLFAALALALALTGCSDDDDASPTSPTSPPATDATGDAPSNGQPSNEAPSNDDEATADAQEAIADAVGGDDRPFGVDDDGLAVAMQGSTRADRVEVDGGTFRLYFDEGSVEDMQARINCSAMNMIKGDDDSVVMVYSDGELQCDDEPE